MPAVKNFKDKNFWAVTPTYAGVPERPKPFLAAKRGRLKICWLSAYAGSNEKLVFHPENKQAKLAVPSKLVKFG